MNPKLYLQQILKLASGSGVSQLIPLLALPVLTRLFTPAEFGILSLYVAVVAVFGSVAVMRYELAISLTKSYVAALNVAALGIVIALVCSVVILCVTLVFRDRISDAGPQYYVLYLIPLGVFSTGVFNCFKFLMVRASQFGSVAKSNIIKSSAMITFQFLLGFSGLGALSLIFGHVAGAFSQVVYSARLVNFRLAIMSVSIKRMSAMMRRYKDFPKYSVWSIFANSVANNGTNMVMPLMFSLSTLGHYGMIQRIMGIPSLLIGNSVGLVFYREAVKERRETGLAVTVFAYTVKRLFIISVCIFGSAFFLIEPVITIFLGPEWQQTAVYGKILMPFFAIRFIGASLPLINAFEKQKIALAWQSMYLLLTGMILGFVFYYDLEIVTMLQIMSVCYSLHYIVLILVLQFIAKGKL